MPGPPGLDLYLFHSFNPWQPGDRIMKTIKVNALRATLLLVIGLLLPHQVFTQEDWFVKGLMLTRARQYDKAIEAFTAAIELIPADVEAYNYRGVARAYQGDFDGAVADYNAALQIKPAYAEALNNRGFAWVQKGNLGRALDDFSRAIEIKPALLDAYNSKAWILATSSQAGYRNGQEAVLLAQKAVKINPGIDSLDTLAAAYAANGQFEDAVSTQKQVVQMLIEQDRTDRLVFYIDHLKTYTAGRALRIDYAGSSPRVEPGKFNKPLTPGAGRNMAPPAAHRNTAVLAGPYPYTIQVSAYRDPAKSVRAAATLANKGEPAFACPVQIPGKGVWHRVFIGSYRSKAAAQRAAVELKKRKFQYAQVTHKPYTVQVGLFDSETAAEPIITRLQAKGYITYSLPDQHRPGHTRLLVGAYATRDEAKWLSEQLIKDGFDTRVLAR
jgi:tetratricopeptide (TPR) repeat protein